MTTLLCLGDSITDCGRILQDPPLGNGYVKQLWDQLSPLSADLQIINKGMDGFTVSRLLQHVDSYLALKPHIITILIGINDIGLMMNTNRTTAQREQMMQAFARDYDQLLDELHSPQRQIILMEPFIFPWPARYRLWIPYVRQMSSLIRKTALMRQLPYILLQDELNQAALRYDPDQITTDGIHLTDAGHQLIAEKLRNIILYKRLG